MKSSTLLLLLLLFFIPRKLLPLRLYTRRLFSPNYPTAGLTISLSKPYLTPILENVYKSFAMPLANGYITVSSLLTLFLFLSHSPKWLYYSPMRKLPLKATSVPPRYQLIVYYYYMQLLKLASKSHSQGSFGNTAKIVLAFL